MKLVFQRQDFIRFCRLTCKSRSNCKMCAEILFRCLSLFYEWQKNEMMGISNFWKLSSFLLSQMWIFLQSVLTEINFSVIFHQYFSVIWRNVIKLQRPVNSFFHAKSFLALTLKSFHTVCLSEELHFAQLALENNASRHTKFLGYPWLFFRLDLIQGYIDVKITENHIQNWWNSRNLSFQLTSNKLLCTRQPYHKEIE